MEFFKFSQYEFEHKISVFQSYINDITLQNTELSFEERRLKISGNFKNKKFDLF